MDVNEENVELLKQMGFPDDNEIRRALRLGNDINDAVAILTNEKPVSDFDLLEDIPSENQNSKAIPLPSPNYDPIVESPPDSDLIQDAIASDGQSPETEDNTLEFPVHSLVDLEQRVFTVNWNIPYRKEESLGQCLLASIRFVKNQLYEQDVNYERFVNNCAPECFKKLLTSGVVHRWDVGTLTGIYNMCKLYIEFIALRLQFDPIPIRPLRTLCLMFDPGSEFHIKNAQRPSESITWSDYFGVGQVYASSPSSALRSTSPYGWLVNFVNLFSKHGGFDQIRRFLDNENLDAPAYKVLVEPIALCAEFLNPTVIKPMFGTQIDKIVTFVKGLTQQDFKEKRIGEVFSLLANLKLLCLPLWPTEVEAVDLLRLKTMIQMLKSQHYNGKMSALVEIDRMIEDAQRFRPMKHAISKEKLISFVRDEKILSLALEGSIDQTQYTGKIRTIVDLLGAHLTNSEITKIWNMQEGQTLTVIGNIQSILVSAAQKCGSDQLQHLCNLIRDTWESGEKCTPRMRQKLIEMCGRIGKETRTHKVVTQILETLWDMAHLPRLSPQLTEMLLQEHLEIVNSICYMKEQIRKTYLIKCVEDIKKNVWVLPALKHLSCVAKSLTSQGYSFSKSEKSLLNDLHKQYDICKLICRSLMETHRHASTKCGSKPLVRYTIVDCNQCTHEEYISAHLDFLHLFLNNTDVSLSWARAKEIWETLVANPKSCSWDKETCFEFLRDGMNHLESDARTSLFQKEILKLDASILSLNGSDSDISCFDCFKDYFHDVNFVESRIKKQTGPTYIVEKEPYGTDFIWRLCLTNDNEHIANQAIDMLLNISYCWLSYKQKRDPEALHRKFIEECYSRIEAVIATIGGTVLSQGVNSAMRVATSVVLPKVDNIPVPSKASSLQKLQRLLLIAERYIHIVEDNVIIQRTILPHGASFHGLPVTIRVSCELAAGQRKYFEVMAHTNEMVSSVRKKIANKLDTTSDNLQLFHNDSLLGSYVDHQLVRYVSIDSGNPLTARVLTGPSLSNPPSYSSVLSSTNYAMELEKSLPSVVMATVGATFELLYSIASLGDERILGRAESLLLLLPSEKSIADMIESLGLKIPRPSSFEDMYSTQTRSPSPRLRHGSGSRKGTHVAPVVPKTTPYETLNKALDSTAEDMSPFRVLYNLQVLSGRLMPTIHDKATVHSAYTYSEQFLCLGGIRLIVNVLQRTIQQPATDSVESDYVLKQQICVLCLQILRYLLCGEISGYEMKRISGLSRSEAMAHCSGEYTTAQANLKSDYTSLRIDTPERKPSENVSDLLTDSPSKLSTSRLSAAAAAGSMETPNTSGLSSDLNDTDLSIDIGILSSATRAVQNMHTDDFKQTVECLMRLSWAAAAGKINLASSSLVEPIGGFRSPVGSSSLLSTVSAVGSSQQNSSETETITYSGRRRSQQSSTGSGTSDNSEPQNLKPGICVHSTRVTKLDSLIARESLALLSTCIQLRSDLFQDFITLPGVSEFCIDILVGCPRLNVRKAAANEFSQLACLTSFPGDVAEHQARRFFIRLLSTARLPFWLSTSYIRGSQLRLLNQCGEYFRLFCLLVTDLSKELQTSCELDVNVRLDDEISWLSNFTPTSSASPFCSPLDNTLLGGHIDLVCSYITCEGVNRAAYGRQLIPDLLSCFLFPASDMISSQEGRDYAMTMNEMIKSTAKCSDSKSRRAVFRLLVELANGCFENLNDIVQRLVKMHHTPDSSLAKEWGYRPVIEGRRSVHDFVGLRNDGATCYMNSVLQQLYMTPTLPEKLLGISDFSLSDESNVFYQIQNIFGHLKESQLAAFSLEKFWKVFKLWGRSVNPREQQDAFDFFTAIVDQLDEYLTKNGKDPIMKTFFQGLFSDQKICQDCPHRYEREEPFFALNLTVKSHTLQDSLSQFVKGDMLDGDNAYFCEKCNKKRNTIKRTCIKKLPPVLCIQLKRFDYDWELNRALKFDDHFKFPWTLDMNPYTSDFLTTQDPQAPMTSSMESSQELNFPSPPPSQQDAVNVHDIALQYQETEFELVGIVIHSGQANAGHYYSFIKDRRGSTLSNPTKGKWFKFNDTSVEEYQFTEENLEHECFGGTYSAKVFNPTGVSGVGLPEERSRHWNAYLLFYAQVSEPVSPTVSKKTRRSRTLFDRVSASGASGDVMVKPMDKARSDSFVELAELVDRGDEKGIFSELIPPDIQQEIWRENLQFMRDRDAFNSEYFTFILDLCQRNITNIGVEDYTKLLLASTQMAVNFLFFSYLHITSSLRPDTNEWLSVLSKLMMYSRESCAWFLGFLASSQGLECLRQALIVCNVQDIRLWCSKLLERLFVAYFQHGGMPMQPAMDTLIVSLLSILDRDAVEYCNHSSEYFSVLSAYASHGTKTCSHLFGKSAFQGTVKFLLGSNVFSTTDKNQLKNRQGRWSSLQVQNFGPLHAFLARLILNCDLKSYRTEVVGSYVLAAAKSSPVPQVLLKMHPDMSEVVFGRYQPLYIREVIQTIKDIKDDDNVAVVSDMLVACSFCNDPFTTAVIKQIMSLFLTATSTELKKIFHLLTALSLIEDPLLKKRLQCIIDGYSDDIRTYDGILTVIRETQVNDSRRCYQSIKFLSNLASKSSYAKDYLMQTPKRWQWAVDWLKKKMQEPSWEPSVTTTPSATSNEGPFHTGVFQRTISAQCTLEEAAALLIQTEAPSSQSPVKSEAIDIPIGTSTPSRIGKDASTSDTVEIPIKLRADSAESKTKFYIN